MRIVVPLWFSDFRIKSYLESEQFQVICKLIRLHALCKPKHRSLIVCLLIKWSTTSDNYGVQAHHGTWSIIRPFCPCQLEFFAVLVLHNDWVDINYIYRFSCSFHTNRSSCLLIDTHSYILRWRDYCSDVIKLDFPYPIGYLWLCT